MKKFVAFLLLFTYLSFSTSALADRFDELFGHSDLVYEEGSFSSDIELISTSEFEFLEVFDEAMAPYSLKSIVAGFANSKIHIDADYSTERDQIFKSHFKITTYSPIKLNEELSIDANAVFHLWFNMNFVNSKKPYYKITLKTPLSEQYFVFCSSDENAILFYPAKNRINNIKEILQEGLRSNAKISFDDGKYMLSISDEGFKKILSHLTQNGYNYLYMLANGSDGDSKNYEKQKQEIPKMMNRLKLIKILGKDGINQHFVFDENEKLSSSELNLNIDTNIFKLHYSITGDPIPSDPNIEKPVINVTNSDINFKINVKTTYSENFTDFYFPRPIKRLITNVFEGDKYALDYTTTEDISSPYETIGVIDQGFTKVIDDTPYIPLRTMMNSLGVNNKSIFWLDGNIEVYEEVVSVLPFKRITMSENNSTVICDGIPVTLSAPVITIDHLAYVPEDFVNKVLDATVLGYNTIYNHYDKKYYTTIEIERLKPVYYVQFRNSSFTIN